MLEDTSHDFPGAQEIRRGNRAGRALTAERMRALAGALGQRQAVMAENRLPKMSLDDLLAFQGEEDEQESRA